MQSIGLKRRLICRNLRRGRLRRGAAAAAIRFCPQQGDEWRRRRREQHAIGRRRRQTQSTDTSTRPTRHSLHLLGRRAPISQTNPSIQIPPPPPRSLSVSCFQRPPTGRRANLRLSDRRRCASAGRPTCRPAERAQIELHGNHLLAACVPAPPPPKCFLTMARLWKYQFLHKREREAPTAIAAAGK